MEVWKILCLLLVTCRSAAQAASSDPPESDPDPGLDYINTTAPITPPSDPNVHSSPGSGSDPGPEVTDSPNRDTTTGGRNISVTPESKTDSVISSSHPHLPEPPASQTPPLPVGSHTPINTTDANTAQTTAVDQHINTTHPASITPSNQPPPPQTPDPLKPATSTTGPTKSRTTPSNSSLDPTASPKYGLNETFSGDPPTSSAPPPSTLAARPPKDTPPQLHVGGDTLVVHESSSVEPLLTGLVSAFIITAVFVTLLLFLKLRSRENRSEFTRLQDVSMDDMMEDTPLSVYSY
ncbi:mucin-2-like isoform X2 [Notolabrus celidotus]|uniref:mucin-2-like isoform X2 n=1 Tax=Notolabrus celidotus TaxID=1203425 RepID=UPI00148FBFBF|nr:mucin-2-like isoform X2 [Notolabrus celidotus]